MGGGRPVKVIHVALLLLRRALKDGAAFWSFALPLTIIYVLGLTLHGLFSAEFVPHRPYRVALVASPGSPGDAVAAALAARSGFIEVVPYTDPRSARDAVVARRADAAVLTRGLADQGADQGEGLGGEVVVVAAPGSIVANVLDSIARAALREVSEASGGAGPSVRGSERRGEAGATPEDIAASVPPEASPPWAGIGSFGGLGAPWLASGWAPLMLSIAGALAACGGMAVAVSGLARSDGQVQLISSALPALLALTGGVFFSLEAAPPALQRLARLNPFYWYARVLEEGFLYCGPAGQAGPVGVLVLVGVLGIVVGVQGLRRSM